MQTELLGGGVGRGEVDSAYIIDTWCSNTAKDDGQCFPAVQLLMSGGRLHYHHHCCFVYTPTLKFLCANTGYIYSVFHRGMGGGGGGGRIATPRTSRQLITALT